MLQQSTVGLPLMGAVNLGWHSMAQHDKYPCNFNFLLKSALICDADVS